MSKKRPNPVYVPGLAATRPGTPVTAVRVLSRPPSDVELVAMQAICLNCKAFSGYVAGSIIGCRDCTSCTDKPADHRRMDLSVRPCPRNSHDAVRGGAR